MTSFFSKAAMAVAFVLLCAAPAPAQTVDLYAIKEVREAEAYLNTLSTMKSRFIQTDARGQQLAGDFMLKRPGRLRFEYDPPVTDFIVADGTFVYYYDGKMQQQSNAPIGQSLANFFLSDKISFTGDVSITDVRREGELLQITLVLAKDPKGGSLTLGFTEQPMALKKWRVLDPQGAITEIELFEPQTGIRLDSDLFRYHNPRRTRPNYN